MHDEASRSLRARELAPPPSWLPPRVRFPHLRIAGVLGGVASGKSTAARVLEEAGCLRLDADALARARLDTGEVRSALLARFGPQVLDACGQVDRAALAQLAFAAPSARRELEELIHPEVRRQMLAALEEEEGRSLASGTPRWVVLDVPLLVESGWIHLCDHVLFLETPAALRDARARADRGWNAGEVARREAAQVPLEVKRRLAERIFANEDVAALREQLLAWLRDARERRD
ncbi:MAG: dephospho-CoA kinase [Planctomycetes bacterium]|nr:dephospho-CoA kinase [Planctomycetota bacterium]